jgi:hypothetical protein
MEHLTFFRRGWCLSGRFSATAKWEPFTAVGVFTNYKMEGEVFPFAAVGVFTNRKMEAEVFICRQILTKHRIIFLIPALVFMASSLRRTLVL